MEEEVSHEKEPVDDISSNHNTDIPSTTEGDTTLKSVSETPPKRKEDMLFLKETQNITKLVDNGSTHQNLDIPSTTEGDTTLTSVSETPQKRKEDILFLKEIQNIKEPVDDGYAKKNVGIPSTTDSDTTLKSVSETPPKRDLTPTGQSTIASYTEKPPEHEIPSVCVTSPLDSETTPENPTATPTRVKRRYRRRVPKEISPQEKRRPGRPASRVLSHTGETPQNISLLTPTRKSGRLKSKSETTPEKTTPTKRPYKLKSNTDIAQQIEDKPVTPAKRRQTSASIGKNTQTYASPRALRAARRNSVADEKKIAGNDSSTPSTPKRQTRRPRKDSSSSVDYQAESLPTAKTLLDEAIIEEPPAVTQIENSQSLTTPEHLSEERSNNLTFGKQELIDITSSKEANSVVMNSPNVTLKSPRLSLKRTKIVSNSDRNSPANRTTHDCVFLAKENTNKYLIVQVERFPLHNNNFAGSSDIVQKVNTDKMTHSKSLTKLDQSDSPSVEKIQLNTNSNKNYNNNISASAVKENIEIPVNGSNKIIIPSEDASTNPFKDIGLSTYIQSSDDQCVPVVHQAASEETFNVRNDECEPMDVDETLPENQTLPLDSVMNISDGEPQNNIDSGRKSDSFSSSQAKKSHMSPIAQTVINTESDKQGPSQNQNLSLSEPNVSQNKNVISESSPKLYDSHETLQSPLSQSAIREDDSADVNKTESSEIHSVSLNKSNSYDKNRKLSSRLPESSVRNNEDQESSNDKSKTSDNELTIQTANETNGNEYLHKRNETIVQYNKVICKIQESIANPDLDDETSLKCMNLKCIENQREEVISEPYAESDDKLNNKQEREKNRESTQNTNEDTELTSTPRSQVKNKSDEANLNITDKSASKSKTESKITTEQNEESFEDISLIENWNSENIEEAEADISLNISSGMSERDISLDKTSTRSRKSRSCPKGPAADISSNNSATKSRKSKRCSRDPEADISLNNSPIKTRKSKSCPKGPEADISLNNSPTKSRKSKSFCKLPEPDINLSQNEEKSKGKRKGSLNEFMEVLEIIDDVDLAQNEEKLKSNKKKDSICDSNEIIEDMSPPQSNEKHKSKKINSFSELIPAEFFDDYVNFETKHDRKSSHSEDVEIVEEVINISKTRPKKKQDVSEPIDTSEDVNISQSSVKQKSEKKKHVSHEIEETVESTKKTKKHSLSEVVEPTTSGVTLQPKKHDMSSSEHAGDDEDSETIKKAKKKKHSSRLHGFEEIVESLNTTRNKTKNGLAETVEPITTKSMSKTEKHNISEQNVIEDSETTTHSKKKKRKRDSNEDISNATGMSSTEESLGKSKKKKTVITEPQEFDLTAIANDQDISKPKKKKEKQIVQSELADASTSRSENDGVQGEKRKKHRHKNKEDEPSVPVNKEKERLCKLQPETDESAAINEDGAEKIKMKRKKFNREKALTDTLTNTENNDVLKDTDKKERKKRKHDKSLIGTQNSNSDAYVSENKTNKAKRRKISEEENVRRAVPEGLSKLNIRRLPAAVIEKLSDRKKKYKTVSTSKFKIEKSRFKKTPSEFLERSVHIDQPTKAHIVSPKRKTQYPKVHPTIPTAQVSADGFTTNFKTYILSDTDTALVTHSIRYDFKKNSLQAPRPSTSISVNKHLKSNKLFKF